ncbi:MAG: UDP-N-acetylmuramate--L-alanine ligase [Crocinitomicaceae bacterium]
MNLDQIHNVYFVGIGGIGMSALARYYNGQGKKVSGYDKTETKLTKALVSEGMFVHYDDQGADVLNGLEKENTLVVYTPAVQESFGELVALRQAGFMVIKRAAALGLISNEFETFAIAGTHGKTTTSAILAHVLYHTKEQCNAFVGGLTTNYNSNCIVVPGSKRMVVEADEFDRSFLQLKPNYAIITTIDSDHLDIYGDGEELKVSFMDFINRINPEGALFIHADAKNELPLSYPETIYSYAFDQDADWTGSKLVYEEGRFYFDIQHKDTTFKRVEFGLPGKHNAENALAVFALCYHKGVSEEIIRKAFASFKGVKRRFEFHIKRDDLIVIDDYAHHPTEIGAFLKAVREIYPKKKIALVFQPHLFSRTRDFMNDFALTLSLADQLYLLPIYPAREEPIQGVTSESLLNKIVLERKQISSKTTIVKDLEKDQHELILIVGAGDIDTCIEPIVSHYS